jgi:cytochrome P450
MASCQPENMMNAPYPFCVGPGRVWSITGKKGLGHLASRHICFAVSFLLLSTHRSGATGRIPLLPNSRETSSWNPSLLHTAVEELLRYESPLQLNNRLATAALELPSGTVAAGTFVTLAVGAANRDPSAFPHPDRLDITRRPNPHVAFGHGAHACAGMNVARLEARVAIGRLLARCPRLESAGPAERDPRVRFRGLRTLPVRLG